MGIDLRMEPYATMCQDDRPELLIFDELCFPDIDKLIDRLGLSWNDFYALVYEEGRVPHEAALRLLAAVESYQAAPEKLLILLQLYRDWREHPDRVSVQMQGISKGRAPGMEGQIRHLRDPRPWLVLRWRHRGPTRTAT
jgi:hypothetical protein